MKRKFTKRKLCNISVVMILVLVSGSVCAQTVLYSENFGVPSSNTLIQNYSGWQDTSVSYIGNGTCDVRASSASNGYGGASGGGNVMINDTVKWFQISGINTSDDYSSLKNQSVNLNIGLRKTINENGLNFRVEFSTDSIGWFPLFLSDTLPVGAGTSGWYRVKYPNVPSVSKLHLRFSSAVSSEYRLDDVCITVGDEVLLETVSAPIFSPAGGTYSEPQTVEITTETPEAVIRYTMDGTTPNEQSDVFDGHLTVSTTSTIKAIAYKDNMYCSEVVTANYTIVDTLAIIILPFDISTNSEVAKSEVKTMGGFKSYKLGTSYSDGGAKFESKNAGVSYLAAHFDGMPDSLYFDLQGRKSGSPASYEGITFLVDESEDGISWDNVTVLNESDISTGGYVRYGPYPLSYKSRYVKWSLVSAGTGNTQLNNIRITKREIEPDEDQVGVAIYEENDFLRIYPNPAMDYVVILSRERISEVVLFDQQGRFVRKWSNVDNSRLGVGDLPKGTYVVRIVHCDGTTVNKVVVKY